MDCALVHTDKLSDIRKKFASLNLRIALFSQRVLFREGCPRELAQLVIRSGRLNWEGYYRLKPHDHLSTIVVRPGLLRSDYQNKIIASRFLGLLFADSVSRRVIRKTVSLPFIRDRKSENLAAVSAVLYLSPLS